jgi:xylulokinase
MALGARNIAAGSAYNSLGSSSWIAVSSKEPLLDPRVRPYVFAHVVPGLFTSAIAIFSAGTTLRWVRDTLCANLVAQADREQIDVYDLMTSLAGQSEPGAGGLIFNPSLAGGTSIDDSPDIRGALIGLDLGHSQADIIRAAMEGVALGLRRVLDELRALTPLCDEMLMVGGGSRSPLWRQICADACNINVVKSNVDEQAAALGAATVAAVGSGLWKSFDVVEGIHNTEHVSTPSTERSAFYDGMLSTFARASSQQSELAAELRSIRT